jgi:hypothetical protein
MLERKNCEPVGEQGPVAQTSVEDEELWKGSVQIQINLPESLLIDPWSFIPPVSSCHIIITIL